MIFTAATFIMKYWKYIAVVLCCAIFAYFIYEYQSMKSEIATLHDVVNGQATTIQNIEDQYQINKDAILKYDTTSSSIIADSTKHKEKVFSISSDTNIDNINDVFNEALARLEGASSK